MSKDDCQCQKCTYTSPPETPRGAIEAHCGACKTTLKTTNWRAEHYIDSCPFEDELLHRLESAVRDCGHWGNCGTIKNVLDEIDEMRKKK